MGCGMGTRDEGGVVGFVLKACNAERIRYSRPTWWAVEEMSCPDGFFLKTNRFPLWRYNANDRLSIILDPNNQRNSYRESVRKYVGFDFLKTKILN